MRGPQSLGGDVSVPGAHEALRGLLEASCRFCWGAVVAHADPQELVHCTACSSCPWTVRQQAGGFRHGGAPLSQVWGTSRHCCLTCPLPSPGQPGPWAVLVSAVEMGSCLSCKPETRFYTLNRQCWDVGSWEIAEIRDVTYLCSTKEVSRED